MFSAREFVWWYNGHPQYRDLPVDLSATRSVAIAGLGNVAGAAGRNRAVGMVIGVLFCFKASSAGQGAGGRPYKQARASSATEQPGLALASSLCLLPVPHDGPPPPFLSSSPPPTSHLHNCAILIHVLNCVF